jgi:hypothetical protein
LVCETLLATPSLPFAPMPTGHSTAVLAPTLDFQSPFTLGEIVGEQEGRARAVRAMHDDDRLRRQLDVGIELLIAGSSRS